MASHSDSAGCARTSHDSHMGARASALRAAALSASMTYEYA